MTQHLINCYHFHSVELHTLSKIYNFIKNGTPTKYETSRRRTRKRWSNLRTKITGLLPYSTYLQDTL